MLNKPLRASYNPDGSFRHLLNADELISSTSGNAKILAEQIFTDNAYAIKQKSSLMWMLMGRTISTGMTEDFLDDNINMKREFTVSPDGRQVDVKIASNMSEEETQKFLKAMLEKAGEEVAGQSEEIFNTLKALGMADINSIGAAHIYVGDGICEPMMTPKQVYQLVRDLRKETDKPITIITGMTWEYLNKYNNTFTYLVQMVPFENIDVKCADGTHLLDEYWIAV